MFKNFKSNFTEFSAKENSLIEMKSIPFKYSELLLEFGGKSFDNGLYTIHTFEDSLKWTTLLSQYFGKDENSFLSFAHDWMGMQYCVSRNTNECIYMFDPATLEDFYVDENLIDFHNNILSSSKVNNLASDLFEAALKYLRITGINYHQCLGFKTPLFLNGKEEVSNYEVCDLEVYWDIEYQLYQQVKNFPEGTRVHNVVIDPFTKNFPL